MPNWCEGTLKVRGKNKDLKKFVLEGLQPITWGGNELEPLQMTEDEYTYNIQSNQRLYIENSYRGFIDGLDAYFDKNESEDDIGIFCIDAEFAWSIHVDDLLETCKKYNVDMKILGFESAAGFNQDVEIVNGEIIRDETITYDDYSWDCPCPLKGG